MNTDRILQLAQHPELLDRDTLYELRNLLSRYPYFTTVRILYLHNLYLLRDPLFSDELKLGALHVSDRKRLFQVIEGHKYEVGNKPAAASATHAEQEHSIPKIAQKPKEKSRTLTLIEQFLSQQPENEPLVPFDLTVDYTTYLLEEKEEDKEKSTPPPTKDLIDAFLNQLQTDELLPPRELLPDSPEKEADPSQSTPSLSPAASATEADSAAEAAIDASFFTETLAKIYIRQGRYEKAIEIYKNIYLKNPKKSAYFADQIRFLEKLIINEK